MGASGLLKHETYKYFSLFACSWNEERSTLGTWVVVPGV